MHGTGSRQVDEWPTWPIFRRLAGARDCTSRNPLVPDASEGYPLGMRVAFPTVLALILSASACVGDDPASAPDAGAPPPGTDAAVLPGVDASTDGQPVLDAGKPDSGTPSLQAISVSAGSTHTCAVLVNGDVVCWGSNGNGELGTPPGALPSSSLPVRVALPSKAKMVSAGDKVTCAHLDNGKVACWGNNDSGQLARSPFSAVGDVKEVVPPPTDARGKWDPVAAVSVGGSHVCVTSVGGPSPLVGKDINYSWCWGKNLFRELARETNGFPSVVPLIATQNGKDSDTNPFYVDKVVSGADFTCSEAFIPVPSGVFFRGLVCWGAANSNQIGKSFGPGQPFGTPSFGAETFLTNPRLAAAGTEHACTIAAKTAGGEALYCWGRATKGAIGSLTGTAVDGKANLVASVDAAKVTHVAAGGDTTCIVESGTFRCLGANASGQLGNGTVDSAPHTAFTTVELPPTVSSVAVGGEHVCVVLGSAPGRPGEVRCWGANRAGQLLSLIHISEPTRPY